MMERREVHLSGTEARAGEKAGVLRYILGISLTAILILFAIILILNR